MKNNSIGTIKRAVTHNGKFHADDVFSAAFLKILNPSMIIERVAEVPKNFSGLAFDIGLGEFDHHQKNPEKRPNGIPYASFGKLWRKYSCCVIGEQGSKNIDDLLVQPIDAADNGRGTNLLSIFISRMNPPWNEESEIDDEQFQHAVYIARGLLLREISIEDYYAKKGIERRFVPIIDINSVVNDIFSRPVCSAMIARLKNKAYAADIRRCMNYETAKDNACDDLGSRCAGVSNVWREYGSVVTNPSVTGSVAWGFFDALNDVITSNKKDDAFIRLIVDLKAHFGDFAREADSFIAEWLNSEIAAAESRIVSREILSNAIKNTDDEIIVLEQFCPWRDVLANSLVKFVVYPSSRGGYCMHVVPVSRTSKEPRLPFPDGWSKVAVEDVQKENPDVTFCHAGGFMITCKTLGGCFNAARQSSDYYVSRHFKKNDFDMLNLIRGATSNDDNSFVRSIERFAVQFDGFELNRLLRNLKTIYLSDSACRERAYSAMSVIQHRIDCIDFENDKLVSLSELIDSLK